MGIEVTNIKHAAAAENIKHAAAAELVRAELTRRCGAVISFSHAPRSGKATIELPSRAAAEAAVRAISGLREQIGHGRGLEARVVAASAAAYTELEDQHSWTFHDASACNEAEQRTSNEADERALYDRLPDGPMRDSLMAAVSAQLTGSGRVIKEFYLATGRPCELVFAGGKKRGSAGGMGGTHVLRSAEKVNESHLAQFQPLFEGLSESHRRTGIDGTLHRISRTIHAIGKECTAITARVGRTIQGHVLPMLVEHPSESPLADLARLAHNGLMLIGPPNSGKTTVLRELARLLSSRDDCVVVVVDKSLEIAGTGVVPHGAIGNARVLTVEHPSAQHRVMLEAVENQSPDIVFVDELSTKEECQAARTISGRGVAVVASVHGESLAQIASDPERSVLIGGVTSVTLSAGEAAKRADKERQVSRRCQSTVFGTAVELRSFGEWIIHRDLEKAVDAYLDYAPFGASWRKRSSADDEVLERVICAPLVGVRQRGSLGSFGYAALKKGEALGEADFLARNGPSGQRQWTPVDAGANIYERTHAAPSAGSAGAGLFKFGGAPDVPVKAASDGSPFASFGAPRPPMKVSPSGSAPGYPSGGVGSNHAGRQPFMDANGVNQHISRMHV